MCSDQLPFGINNEKLIDIQLLAIVLQFFILFVVSGPHSDISIHIKNKLRAWDLFQQHIEFIKKLVRLGESRDNFKYPKMCCDVCII